MVRQLDCLTTHASLSPIRRVFAPGFVNYRKGCTQLAYASDTVYQLLAHGRWFSPASTTAKTGHHSIAEILLKVALNTMDRQFRSWWYHKLLLIDRYSFIGVLLFTVDGQSVHGLELYHPMLMSRPLDTKVLGGGWGNRKPSELSQI